jgi:hypothetical protein
MATRRPVIVAKRTLRRSTPTIAPAINDYDDNDTSSITSLASNLSLHGSPVTKGITSLETGDSDLTHVEWSSPLLTMLLHSLPLLPKSLIALISSYRGRYHFLQFHPHLQTECS